MNINKIITDIKGKMLLTGPKMVKEIKQVQIWREIPEVLKIYLASHKSDFF